MPMARVLSLAFGAAFAACATIAGPTGVLAQPLSVEPRCEVPAALLSDPAEFPNAARHVGKGNHLTIVALGAASTEGTGASSPQTAWPMRLQEALVLRLPGTAVKVVNLGKRGSTAQQMLQRFNAEVVPAKPAIVIWEVGTVEAVRATDTEELHAALMEGMDQIEAMHADLILMDPQYARSTDLVINFQPYLQVIRQTADLPEVTLFPRHDIMRYWVEEGRIAPTTREEMVKGNDALYDCVAQLLAEVIDHGLSAAAHAAR